MQESEFLQQVSKMVKELNIELIASINKVNQIIDLSNVVLSKRIKNSKAQA